MPKTERNRWAENEYNTASFDTVTVSFGQNKDEFLTFPFISLDFLTLEPCFVLFFFPKYLRTKLILSGHVICLGFPGGSDGKESACSAGDLGWLPGSGRSPGEGDGNPLLFLPGESHGQSSLVGYKIHAIAERRTRLRD